MVCNHVIFIADPCNLSFASSQIQQQEWETSPQLMSSIVILHGVSDRLPIHSNSAGLLGNAAALQRRPGFIAKRLCPELVFVKPDFSKYASASKMVQAIFKEYDQEMDAASLDEAYMDVSDFCEEQSMSGQTLHPTKTNPFQSSSPTLDMPHSQP